MFNEVNRRYKQQKNARVGKKIPNSCINYYDNDLLYYLINLPLNTTLLSYINT